MNYVSEASGPRIIVALDMADAERAEAMAGRLDPALCRLKVGKELFTAAGPTLLERLRARGFEIFLDLKFHDIPNTVAGACHVAAELGVWMINVHALGGRRMLEAAREAVDHVKGARPLVTAVTVLTSMSREDMTEVGLTGDPTYQVVRLAKLAQQSGMDGVVCSAHEAPMLRENHGTEFLLVTPGIRPAGSDAGDQRRVMTPKAALEAGSDYLVVGRPVTRAEDPMEVLQALHAEVEH